MTSRRALYALPAPLRAVTAVEPDGASHVEAAFFVWDDADRSPPGSLLVTGDWGDAERRDSLTAPEALSAAAEEVDTPSDPPYWWEDGATVLWGDEILILAEVGDTETALLRSDPIAHDATADVTQLRVGYGVRQAAIGMARRMQWLRTVPDVRPPWTDMMDGFTGALRWP